MSLNSRGVADFACLSGRSCLSYGEGSIVHDPETSTWEETGTVGDVVFY